jgi:TLC domain
MLSTITEPLRTAQCTPPLTSLHRILPAFAMGYAFLDIIDGFTVGIDFLIHGILTMAVMLFFCEQNRPDVVAPFLLMECSTIFLNFVRATFLDETGSLFVQLLFAVTFTLVRILILPPLHAGVTLALFRADTSTSACDPPYFKWVVLLFGLSFHALNAFWFYKLIRKILRKVSGKEKIKDKLSLSSTTKSD